MKIKKMMCMENILLTTIFKVIGYILLFTGCFFEFIGAVGVLRFPNFFSRIHAATVSAVGGTVVPLIGLFLIVLTHSEMGWTRYYLAFLCIISAILILLVAPTGSQILLKTAYKKIENCEKNYGENKC